MRVLMIGNDARVKGGITSVISQMLKFEWEKHNIEMKFIPTYVDSSAFYKVLFFFKAYIKIIIECNKNKPDVVHMHMSYRGSFTRKYLIYKLCKRKGIQVVVHLHGSEFEKWFNETKESERCRIRELLKGASAFIVLGEKWKTVIKKIEPKTNVIVLMNSIKLQEEHNKWNQPCSFLYLGVLIPRKGVSDLLDACRMLRNHNENLKFRLVIAGTGSEEEALKAKCRKNQLDDRVIFAGWIDGKKKEKLLLSNQVLVLPSYNEGLPIAILEAMSYGLPIIATDVGDVSAALHHNINGYLIHPGNVEELCNAMKKICSKRQFEVMSKESLKIVSDSFSETVYFEKVVKLYKSITK